MNPFSLFPTDYNIGVAQYFHVVGERGLCDLQIVQ